MGKVTTILHCQWRAYWRRLVRPGSLTVGNQGILLIVSVLFLLKYVRALGLAGDEIAKGNTGSLERLLFAISVAWLFPLLSSARLTVATRLLRHLPLSLKELFLIRACSLLLPPFAWMVVAGSFAIAFPLARGPRPIPGMLAAVLYILICWLIGLTVAHTLSVPALRRLLFWGLIAVISFVGFYTAQAQNPLRSLSTIHFSPATLVTGAAVGETSFLHVGLLLLLLTVSGMTALGTFKLSLNSSEDYRARRFSLISLFAGKTGPLSAKDLRYFIRLLDPYFGVLLSAIGCFYLLFAEARSPEVFWIFIIVVFFPSASIVFNSFGLDTYDGLKRYALLPVSGGEIIRSKNIAFLMLVGAQLAPLFLLALFTLEVNDVILGLLAAILLALAYMTWGNWNSISDRFQMQFFRFSSGGSPIEALAGVLFGTAPGAIAVLLFSRGLFWVTVPMLVVYAALYLTSLWWSGRRFNKIIEQT